MKGVKVKQIIQLCLTLIFLLGSQICIKAQSTMKARENTSKLASLAADIS